jgi:pilus assembly protein FimV
MAYKKHDTAHEHDYAHALVAGASMVMLAILLALVGAYAQAATLGKLTLVSALGQPLRAEIEVQANRHELNALGARLAAQGAYHQAGLQPAQAPDALTFRLDRRSGGRYVLAVSSIRPLNEPVLDLVVELAWRTGVRSYGYRVLVDPPGRSAGVAAAPVWMSDEHRAAATGAHQAVPARASKAVDADRRMAAQLREKEEAATLQKQMLAEAKERIADLELTVRQQQQLLDMETAAAAARSVSADAPSGSGAAVQRVNYETPTAVRPPASRPASTAGSGGWAQMLSEAQVYLAGAGAVALVLGGLLVFRRRRNGSGDDRYEPTLQPVG